MASISDIFSDELTNHSIDLLRVEADIKKRVLGRLKLLEKSLIKDLSSIDPTSTDSEIRKANRLSKLLEQTQQSIKSAYRDMRDILDNDLLDVSEMEVDYTRGAFNKIFKAEVVTTAIPLSVLKNLNKSVLIEGAPSSEWWGRQAGTLQKSFSDEMSIGVMRGEGINDLVRRVRGRATGKRHLYEINGKRKMFVEFEGGLMDTGTRQAAALVRTSVQNVANTSRLSVYEANSDIIKHIQALVSLDNATSDICKARSGNTWDLLTKKPIPPTKEKFPSNPPWHWNCRSTLIPVTKSFKELSKDPSKIPKGFENLPESTQASMDGQVAGNLTYNDWLKKKPAKEQMEILGKSKYEIFKSGNLTLRDLVDQQSGRPLKVAELKEKYSDTGKALTTSVSTKSSKGRKSIKKYDDSADEHFVGVSDLLKTYKIDEEIIAEATMDNTLSIEFMAGLKGISSGKYVKKCEEHIQKLFNSKNTYAYVSIESETLADVLKSKRLKNQFETGTGGGYVALTKKTLYERRGVVEKALMGVPDNSSARKRPIYGFVSDLPREEVLKHSQYGNVRLKLKRSKRKDTTVVFGDSLDNQKRLPAHPINEFKWTGAPYTKHTYFREGEHPVDILNQKTLASLQKESSKPYVEIQMHGGVSIKDIQEVIFKVGTVSNEVLEEFRKLGIRVTPSK